MQHNFTRLCLATVIGFAVLASSIPIHAQDPDLIDAPHSDWGVASPDGGKLAFVSDSTGREAIWISSRSGTNARPLLAWAGSEQKDPDWSPDGQRIAFSSNRGGKGFNIWTAGVDGTKLIQLTANTNDNFQPRYSADGQRILFLSNRTGKRELWYMNSDGSNQRAIALQSLVSSDARWSPDGTKIVYTACTPPDVSNGTQTTLGRCNLFWTRLDASQTAQITFGNFQDWNPDWGLNGIVFASDRGRAQGLWLVNPDGSNLRQLTKPGPTGDLHPKWDSVSNSVVFTRAAVQGDKAATNLWSSDLSGNSQQLTTIRGFIAYGDVNVDGSTDCADVAVVRLSFGRRSGQSGFDSRADINGDGLVDVRDLSFVAQRIPAGTQCP